MTTYVTYVPSPVAMLYAASDGTSLTGLWLKGQKYYAAGLPENVQNCPELPVFQQLRDWLDAYFGEEPFPKMPSLSPVGTPFRQAVWEALREIPYGQTVTYGELARRLQARGISASARAVGGAVGHNPISILIPCHRVLGADGSLTGYAGGVEAKRFLLELEQDHD